MPKSKRAKVVHLSKVEKKGKDLSIKLFAAVRENADRYQYCFVFDVANMRNTYLKDVRDQLSDSRLFFGKTKVMAKAIGLNPQEEHLPGMHKLSNYLAGNVGLLFTAQEPSGIIEFFDGYTQTDFARAGTVATRTVVIPEGVVYSRGGEITVEDDVPVPHSQESTLRGWGMPTRLVKGKVMLDGDFTVCEEGKAMNSNQTALLKAFGVTMADFKIKLIAYYDSALEQVQELESADD